MTCFSYVLILKPKQKESPRQYWQISALDGAIWRWPIAHYCSSWRRWRHIAGKFKSFLSKKIYSLIIFQIECKSVIEFLPFQFHYCQISKRRCMWILFIFQSYELVLMRKSLWILFFSKRASLRRSLDMIYTHKIFGPFFHDNQSSVFLWFSWRTGPRKSLIVILF